MSVSRQDLMDLRRKAEDDYHRDIEAIDRMLARFFISGSREDVGVHRAEITPVRRRTVPPSGLEDAVRDCMTRGGFPSPWSARGIYDMLKERYPFTQQDDAAVNSILYILKSLAAKGLTHEETGRGRRPSFFTWDADKYPQGLSNKDGLLQLAASECTEHEEAPAEAEATTS